MIKMKPRSARVSYQLACKRSEILVASNTARATPDDPDAAEILERARADYAAATIADYVQRVVAEWPPLTEAQRDRIALLLKKTSDG